MRTQALYGARQISCRVFSSWYLPGPLGWWCDTRRAVKTTLNIFQTSPSQSVKALRFLHVVGCLIWVGLFFPLSHSSQTLSFYTSTLTRAQVRKIFLPKIKLSWPCLVHMLPFLSLQCCLSPLPTFLPHLFQQHQGENLLSFHFALLTLLPL